MLSIQMNDIRQFMNTLLTTDSFDPFFLVEASLRMGVTYHIDGRLNRDFYDSDLQISREFCLWKEIRSHILSILKGKRMPLSMKIILALPGAVSRQLIQTSPGSLTEEDVQGMYLNILFTPDRLTLTTGLATRTFTMDRTLEQAFDDYIREYLKARQLS